MKKLFKYSYIFLVLFCFNGEATCPEVFRIKDKKIRVSFKQVHLKNLDSKNLNSLMESIPLDMWNDKQKIGIESFPRVYKELEDLGFTGKDISNITEKDLKEGEKDLKEGKTFYKVYFPFGEYTYERYLGTKYENMDAFLQFTKLDSDLSSNSNVYMLLTDTQFSYLRKNWKKKGFAVFEDEDLDLPKGRLSIIFAILNPPPYELSRMPFM